MTQHLRIPGCDCFGTKYFAGNFFDVHFHNANVHHRRPAKFKLPVALLGHGFLKHPIFFIVIVNHFNFAFHQHRF